MFTRTPSPATTSSPVSPYSVPSLLAIYQLLRSLRQSLILLDKILQPLFAEHAENGWIWEDINRDREEHCYKRSRGLTDEEEKAPWAKEKVELDRWKKESDRLLKLTNGIEENKKRIFKTIEVYDRLTEGMEKSVV